MKFVHRNGCLLNKNNRDTDARSRVTHLLLDNGCITLRSFEMLQEFRSNLKMDKMNNSMPSITENHTTNFPMYIDFDGELLTTTISDTALLRMATIMSSQAHRFFPERHVKEKIFQCIVCSKPGEGERLGEDLPPRYKLGVHFHWPNLFVDIDRAYELRQSFIAGLDLENWEEHFQEHRLDWDKQIDASVYRGGLRMLGTPKAKKCSSCTKSDCTCITCGGCGYTYILKAYEIHSLVLNGAVDSDLTSSLKGNFGLALEATTVRANENTLLTSGYRRYEGCPPVPAYHFTTSGKRKMPVNERYTSMPRKLEARFKRQEDIYDPEIHAIVRTLLLKMSVNYQRTRLSIRFDGKVYKILMSGDGAHFCLNKGGMHGGNNVYAEIKKDKSRQFKIFMKCWSEKPALGVSGCPCSSFISKGYTLNDQQTARLYSMHSNHGKS